MTSLLVYAFAAVGFVIWVFTQRRKPKLGEWIDPPRERTLNLRRFKGAA